MNELKDALLAALNWLSGPATVRDGKPVGKLGEKFQYDRWNGAVRGEYYHKQWDSFCPVWHTGQAVKAYVLAAKGLEDDSWLAHAGYSADFILNQQISEGKNAGLLKAYEAAEGQINTSAILEALDGLLMLSEATGDRKYRNAALNAMTWVAENAWQDELGKFYDIYNLDEEKFEFGIFASQNRPLLDDAVFLKGWHLSGNKRFRDIAFATAETLIADENPAGNWIKYIPCDAGKGNIHPRHAYWWGLPMLDMYRESGDKRFLAVFLRSVEWYRKAIRRDGGLFRDTYMDFSTASFGHAASGSACAAICFEHYWNFSGDETILPSIELALSFCRRMQLNQVSDPNLQGAILEKVCFPDGSDNLPFHLRDLGTIFFIQAAALELQRTQKH
ncbi:MAG: hypothetical protein ACI4UV_08180 [Victivallales bacterium]